MGDIMTLLELFISLGYTEEQYLIIRNDYTFRRMTDDTLFINVLVNYKWFAKTYGKQNVIKITTRHPMLYGLNIENMEQKLKDLISLGYTRNEAIQLTLRYPNIFGYTIIVSDFFNFTFEKFGYFAVGGC